MARPQNRNDSFDQNVNFNKGNEYVSDDWQALRSNLVNLLSQVENHVSNSREVPTNSGTHYNNPIPNNMVPNNMVPNNNMMRGQNTYQEAFTANNIPLMQQQPAFQQPTFQQPPQQQQPNYQPTTPPQNLQEGHNAKAPRESLSKFSSSDEQTSKNDERFNNFAQTLEKITSRIEQFDSKIGNNEQVNLEFGQVKQQVSQLTKTIEIISSDAGKTNHVTNQVKQLGSQIEKLVQIIEKNQDSDLSDVTNRIDGLSQNIEQFSQIQKDAIEKDKTELLEINANNEQNMLSINESVAKIYDQIDNLNQGQGTGIEPQNIERLFQEMGTISSETAAIYQQIENGKSDKNIDDVLNRIDMLSEEISYTKDDDGTLGNLRFELETLHENIRSALDPKFSTLETHISDLKKILRSPDGKLPVEKIEEQIRGLVSKTNQTNEQLSIIAELSQPKQPALQVENPEAVANYIVQQTVDAISNNQHFSQNNIIKKIDDRLENLTNLLSQRLTQDPLPTSTNYQPIEVKKEQTQQSQFTSNLVEENAKTAEEALAQIRQRFLQDDNQEDSQSDIQYDIQNNTEYSPNEQEIQLSKEQDITNDAQNNDYIDLLDEEVDNSTQQQTLADVQENEPELIDNNDFEYGEETGHSLSEEFDLVINNNDQPFEKQELPEEAAAQQESPQEQYFGQLSNISETSQLVREALDEAKTASKQSNEFDNNEQPAKPKSIFAEQSSSAFSRNIASENAKSIDDNRPEVNEVVNPTSRNTFIEAARRAAKRQNNAIETKEPDSLIAKAFSRFQKKTEQPQVNKVEFTHETKEQTLTNKEAKETKTGSKGLFENILKREKKKKPKATKTEVKEATSESNISRYLRPALLASALVVVIALSFNLMIKRLDRSTDTIISSNNSASSLQLTSDTNSENVDPAIIADNEENFLSDDNTNPLVDNEVTGSINSTQNMDNNTPRVIVQTIPKSIISNSDAAKPETKITISSTPINITQIDSSISTSSISNTVAQEPNQKLETIFTPSPINLELPNEKIGPLALRQAAADGDVRAQFEVGAIYGEGKALEQDFANAAIWYERAAANGFAPAGLRLGGLYESGKGIEKNFEQAKLWYQRAAEAGNRMAMHNLASLYANGSLGEQKFLEATEWFERAAKYGLTDSQFNLGMLFARGLGVEQDFQMAYFWFSIAAKNGDKDAIKARDDVARSLDSNIIMQLQAKIGAWENEDIEIKANFAPIGTWATDFNPGQTIKNKKIIEKVQTALSRIGYDVGTPDGLMGPRTRDAIHDFEKATGMSPSGEINPRLLAVLGSQPV